MLGVFGRAKQPGHDPCGQSPQADRTVLAHALGISHQRIWQLATAAASLTSVEVWADGGTLVSFVKDTSHLRSSMSLAR